MPVEGGDQEQPSRRLRCRPAKQEPAGHAHAWRKHWTPRTGALTDGCGGQTSHLHRKGGRPLTLTEARLLRRIHRGEDVRRSLTKSDRELVLPALLRRDLVGDGDGDGDGPVVAS